MAQLVASMSGVVLGGVVEVVGSNLARGKIFTASIGSVDSLYPSVYIYIYIYIYGLERLPVKLKFQSAHNIYTKPLPKHVFWQDQRLVRQPRLWGYLQ